MMASSFSPFFKKSVTQRARLLYSVQYSSEVNQQPKQQLLNNAAFQLHRQVLDTKWEENLWKSGEFGMTIITSIPVFHLYSGESKFFSSYKYHSISSFPASMRSSTLEVAFNPSYTRSTRNVMKTTIDFTMHYIMDFKAILLLQLLPLQLLLPLVLLLLEILFVFQEQDSADFGSRLEESM